jgi:hypothetical protein
MILTKSERLLAALKKGQDFTANQIENRFDIAYPASAITALRQEGYAIYANRKMTTFGEQILTYRLGTPTRRMVAAGYDVLGAHEAGLTA